MGCDVKILYKVYVIPTSARSELTKVNNLASLCPTETSKEMCPEWMREDISLLSEKYISEICIF